MRRLIFLVALAIAAAPLAPAETITNYALQYTLATPYSGPVTTTLNFAIPFSQALSPKSDLSGSEPSNYTFVFDNLVVNNDPSSLFSFSYSDNFGGFYLIGAGSTIGGSDGEFSGKLGISSSAPYLLPGTITSSGAVSCFVKSFGLTTLIDSLSLVVTQSSQSNSPVAPTQPLAVTPEPNSFALLGTGVLGVGTVLRRRMQGSAKTAL